MIPDASKKLRNAAGLLQPGARIVAETNPTPRARVIYGYLEGDVLRHLAGEDRKALVRILGQLRAEASPGAPTWEPDTEAVRAELHKLADSMAENEPVRLTRREWREQLSRARAEGHAEAATGADGMQKPQRKRQEADHGTAR